MDKIKAKIYLLAVGLVVVAAGAVAGQAGAASDSGFAPPLTRANERVTKKPFGIFVSPKNSPIQPERFTGWHTGAQRAVINNMVPLCSVGFQFVTLGIGTSYTFGNDTAQPLTPGAAYHFRITSGNGNVYRARYQSSGNVYNNGEMARQERAPNWETLPDADLSFKTLY